MKASRQQPPMPCLSDDNASGIAPNLEDSWTFLENAGHDRSTTSRVVPAEERRPAAKQEGDGEEYADLSPFITAPIKCEASDGASHFDADADVPLPRSHVEVVKARRLKSEAGRRRARLQSSEEATRPFSRQNRAATATLLMARETRSRQEAQKAKNATLGERGIDEDLTQEMRGLNVLDQAQHPTLESVPLLSRAASDAGATQVRGRRDMAFITKAFELVDDNDHRALAITMQAQGLDDAWTALLGSTLEVNRTVRSVNLNRNSIGDKGVALLVKALYDNSSVEILSLGGNRLTDKAARSLADLMRSGCSSLAALNLAGVAPPPVSIMQSGSGVKDALAGACIRAPGAASLALALGDPASSQGRLLLVLNLAFQRVWDAGAIALAAALQSPSCHLQALGLSCTQLTDVAALAFSRALDEGQSRGQEQPHHKQKHRRQEKGHCSREGERVQCPLRRLDLSRNKVTDEGARALAVAMVETSLRHQSNDSVRLEEDDVTPVLRANNPCKDRDSPSARIGLLGLDLAHNSVGPAGIVALGQALTAAKGIIFLELRGNSDNKSDIDDPLLETVDPRSSVTLEEIGKTCACRRRRLESLRSDRRRVVRSRESVPVNARGLGRPRREARTGASDFVGGSATAARIAEGIGSGAKTRQQVAASTTDVNPNPLCRGGGLNAARQGEPLTRKRETPLANLAPTAETTLRCEGSGQRLGTEGSVEHAPAGFPPGGLGCSAAKPRPLEGALPMRGSYLSPLLDSCFDLLMLREPVPDPDDLKLYVNQTRNKLKQRRLLRERKTRSSRGGGSGDRDRGGGETALPAFPADTVVSPLAIHLEREQVFAERRLLFHRDSDFATRKNARIAGRGSSRAPFSKLLTQKHRSKAFTRELLSPHPTGVGSKCPSGLRSHFLGLQNFEYDWGANAK